MLFEYNIKGITLKANDLLDIKEYYDAACTAEYVYDNYDNIDTEEEALYIGYEVRRIMNKYDMDEDDAINKVLSELHDKREPFAKLFASKFNRFFCK